MYPDLTQQMLQMVELQRRQTEALNRVTKAIEAQTMAINALAASNEGIINVMMDMIDSGAESENGDELRIGASFDDVDSETL